MRIEINERPEYYGDLIDNACRCRTEDFLRR